MRFIEFIFIKRKPALLFCLFNLAMSKISTPRSGLSKVLGVIVVLVIIIFAVVQQQLKSRRSAVGSLVIDSSKVASSADENANNLGLPPSVERQSVPPIAEIIQPSQSRMDPVEFIEFTQRSGREAFGEIFTILTKHNPCRTNTDFALTLTALTYIDLWDANDLFTSHWGSIEDTEITFQLQELSPGIREPNISVNRDRILTNIEDMELARRNREFAIRRIRNAGVELSDQELTHILKLRPNQSLMIAGFTQFNNMEWYDTNHMFSRSESRDSGELNKSQIIKPAVLPWNFMRTPEAIQLPKP
jgi:hypothetical protein